MEAKNQQVVTQYGGYLAHSTFTCPMALQAKKTWGVIKRIGGQKPRVAGFFENHIFHCVFLDIEHQFYPTKKKNT